MNKLSRRDILKHMMLAAGAGVSSQVFLRDVRANTPVKTFFLYIHCGSWDGVGSGLLQPNSTSGWPVGCFMGGKSFVPGEISNRYVSTGEIVGNPLVNRITAVNNHLLSHYAMPLAAVSNNLLHVTCSPSSLDHNVAKIIQQTGAASGQAHWVSGLAQVFRDSGADVRTPMVVNCRHFSGRTPSISNVQATSLTSFRDQFVERVFTDSTVPRGLIDGFADAGAAVFDQYVGPSLTPGGFKTTYRSTVDSIINGIPGIASNSPAVLSFSQAINETTVKAKVEEIFGNNDAAGIVAARHNGLIDRLALAGALAASSAAYGMVIDLDGQDSHSGGADITTARLGANLWTHLAMFWKWLEAQGIQDRVTVIVTHEFARTAWNNYSKRDSVIVDGSPVQINSPGRDHALLNGLYVLNSKIKSGARFGGIRDGYAAAGSTGLNSAPVSSRPAPTTQQALGTVFLTLFPQFQHPGQPNSGRRVRGIWPTFSDTDIVGPLREIL